MLQKNSFQEWGRVQSSIRVIFTKGCSCKEIAQRLDHAAQDADGLFSHALFATVLDEVRPQGLLPLVDERFKKNGHLEGLAEQLEAIAVRQMDRCGLGADEIPRQQTG